MEITQADVEQSSRDLSRSMDNLIETALEVKAQRDELLEALKDALRTIKALHGPVAWEIYERSSPEMKRYRSAITKATAT